MKINSPVDALNGRKAESSASTPAQTGSANAKSAGSTPASASIQLSPLSTQIKSLASTLGTATEFDAQKVAAIKQAIRDGTLTVHADVIADKMLTDLRDALGGKTKP